MKKTAILFLAVVLLLSISVVALFGCSLFKGIKLDEVKSNLKNAGYEITVMTGEEYEKWEDADPFVTTGELETYLYAVKGSDYIHIFFFTNNDTASYNSDILVYPELYSGQSNNVIYYATKQARKDAKL